MYRDNKILMLHVCVKLHDYICLWPYGKYQYKKPASVLCISNRVWVGQRYRNTNLLVYGWMKVKTTFIWFDSDLKQAQSPKEGI